MCSENAGIDQIGFISDVGCIQTFLNRNTPPQMHYVILLSFYKDKQERALYCVH